MGNSSSPYDTDPGRLAAITATHLKAVVDSAVTPNRVYTFKTGTPALLCLGQSTRRYFWDEQGIYPSLLRVHPDAYQEVLPFLIEEGKRGDSHLCYFLDGRIPILVVPFLREKQEQRYQVECVGSRKTGPILMQAVVSEEIA